MTTDSPMRITPITPIPTALLAEVIEALERVGCEYNFCDGPTLEPVDMVTCYVCETLAKLRVAAGRPARRDDEMTFEQRDQDRHERYMAVATGRNR
jgi:hypothetical protein